MKAVENEQVFGMAIWLSLLIIAIWMVYIGARNIWRAHRQVRLYYYSRQVKIQLKAPWAIVDDLIESSDLTVLAYIQASIRARMGSRDINPFIIVPQDRLVEDCTSPRAGDFLKAFWDISQVDKSTGFVIEANGPSKHYLVVICWIALYLKSKGVDIFKLSAHPSGFTLIATKQQNDEKPQASNLSDVRYVDPHNS